MPRVRDRLQTPLLLLLLLLTAITLAAHTHLPDSASAPLCFTAGSATYRLAAGTEAADYTVEIAAPGATADLRMQLVDDPQDADFVLVDDFPAGEGTPCKASAAMRTVKLADRDSDPDVTISLSTDAGGADYRLYVRSARFSHADAAALLGVMWKADQKQHLAATR